MPSYMLQQVTGQLELHSRTSLNTMS